MDEWLFDLMDLFKKPSVTETLVDILVCAVPIWLAVMIGLVIGWSWRPRWTSLVFIGLRSKFQFLWTLPPGFGARRLWLALSAFSVCRTIWFNLRGRNVKSAVDVPVTATTPDDGGAADSVSEADEGKDVVTELDLEQLLHLLEGKDERMEWQPMMERSTSNMAYQAWRHDPQNGPTIYRSRTVYEDASPELVRDFFWDDEFRLKWDPMLVYLKILEEFPRTGTMVVHWIKKFPFFCSDREYIIGRGIWEAGKMYYCVTKGLPYPGLHQRDNPRRVELYFSSWVIRAVESRKGDGQMSACEVTLFHYEDMGIPKDVARLALRHGMWGTVKKFHSGFRAYQNARKSGASLSRCALMARNTTKISSDKIIDSSEPATSEDVNHQLGNLKRHKDHGIDWKWIVVGGTVALFFGLRSGAVGKSLLLGAGQRIARR